MKSGVRLGRNRVNDIASEAAIGMTVNAAKPISHGEIHSRPVIASLRCKLRRRPVCCWPTRWADCGTTLMTGLPWQVPDRVARGQCPRHSMSTSLGSLLVDHLLDLG